MAPPRFGCCQGAPPGEPGALFWGRDGPGVPPIILPSPGGCGCPPCLPLVEDVGAPLLREGGPWVTHCLAVLRTCWGGPILPHCPAPAPFPPSLCPPPQNGSQVLFPSVPQLGRGVGSAAAAFHCLWEDWIPPSRLCLPGGWQPLAPVCRGYRTGNTLSPSKNAGSLSALGA